MLVPALNSEIGKPFRANKGHDHIGRRSGHSAGSGRDRQGQGDRLPKRSSVHKKSSANMTVPGVFYSKLRPSSETLDVASSPDFAGAADGVLPKGRSLSDEASGSFRRPGEVGPYRITRRLDRPDAWRGAAL